MRVLGVFGGDFGRIICGVLDRVYKGSRGSRGRREMSEEEGFWDGKVRCPMREAAGAVVLRGQDFPFLFLFLLV